MPYLELADARHFYEDDKFTDPWTEPEIVWIQHGWSRSSQFFYHWVPALARHYRVLRRDLRGHGRSSDPEPGHIWSIAELLEDMVGFMDALGLKKIHYVGDSVGGVLGAIFAANWPDRLKSLTMMSTPIADPTRNSMKSYGYSDLVEALGTLGIEGHVSAVIKGGGLSILSPQHEKWVIAQHRSNRITSLQGLARLFPAVDISDVLPNIKVPTLFLSPARSRTAPLDEQKRMHAMVPGARMVIIDGIGHEIYVDQAAACLHALTDFLARVDGRE